MGLDVVVAVYAAALIALASPAAAQQSIAVGSVSGRVVDASGAVVGGAAVSVRQSSTGLTSTSRTDREGRFRFPYLPVGSYELSVEHAGFEPATRVLTVAAGAAFELPVVLAVAGVTTAVTVSAGATVIDAARSQVAATLTREEIDAVPLNGRNFLEVALLAPGVAPANVASTQLFPETSAVPGVSLSVNSQRNLSNNFVVDGLSANDDAAALSSITFSVDALEQLQVITSGAQAELGRALGGYVNVVTRSGSNLTSGTGYTFFRDSRTDAANPLTRTALPLRQWQYGASLGGAIRENRTFYFLNVEERRLRQTGVVTIAPSAVAAINARLQAVGYPGAPVSTGTYRAPLHSTNVLAKVDHRASERSQLTVRLSGYFASAENARGAGGLNAPSASSNLDNGDYTVAAAHTLSIGSRTLLETRGQVAHGRLLALPSDAAGPSVTIAGVATFGRLSSSPTGRTNTLSEVATTLSHQAGAHAIRGGLDVLYNADRITFPRAVRGTYTFSSLANFLAGTYSSAGFTQTFGASDVRQANPNIGAFIQDEWKLTPAVTLNLGLRYDVQWLETIHTDLNNVAPRLGIAWAPFSARRTVIRGSAGLFYDRVPLRAVANALLSAGNTTDVTQLRQNAITLSPTQTGAPAFPAVLSSAVPSVTLPALTTMDPHLQNGVSRQASAEIEQQIGDGTTVSATYQLVRGRHLLMSVNRNVPTCPAAGGNNGCREVAGYANNNQYSSAGSSNYHGLHLSLVQRASRWGHVRASYTLSRSMNDVGEFFFSGPLDPWNVHRDWGRSDDDQRHRFVLSGTVTTSRAAGRTAAQALYRNLQLSVLLRAYSAPPLNVTSGLTTVQGTAARPLADSASIAPIDVRTAVFVTRNAGSGSDFASLDVRLVRTFHPAADRLQVEAAVEAFNLTNRTNVVTRNPTFGTGVYPTAPARNFRQVTSVADPRNLQFSLRLRF